MEVSDNEINDFKIEAAELLNEAEGLLLNYESKYQNNFAEFYNGVFRVFHSLKGCAGMLGLSAIQQHMHKIEDLFQTFKTIEKMSVSEISFFLLSIDATHALMDGETISFNYELSQPEKTEKIVQVNTATIAQPPAGATTVDHSERKIGSGAEAALPNPFKVFVVDDDRDFAEQLRLALESNRFSLKCFSTVEDAISQIKIEKPDLVLTDFSMPEQDGISILKWVRSFDRDLPVVMLSGAIPDNKRDEAFANGVHTLFKKPFDAVAMSRTLEKFAEKYRLAKILEQSINLLFYRFSDVDSYLAEHGVGESRKYVAETFQRILKERRDLNTLADS